MQLTTHTDLALRVLMHLAINRDELANIKDIAERYNVSRNHLVKVVHKLVKLGFVNSTQGRGGGISIASEPEKISIGNVVRKMESNLEIIDCEKANCPLLPVCLLKGVLNTAASDFLASLDKHTIADIVSNLNISKIQSLLIPKKLSSD